MFCVNCGKSLSNDFRFCPYCGNVINKIENFSDTAIDTSKPEDFHIVYGSLRKYTGNSEYVVIPDTVTSVDSPCTSHYSNDIFKNTIKTVVLPSSLKELGQGAFAYTDLESINIPDGVTIIKNTCFRGCKHLKKIIIPSSVEEICAFAFADCESLTEVVLNEGIKIIRSKAFENCTSLKKIHIPDSVKVLDERLWSSSHPIFSGCYLLADITYPQRFSASLFRGTPWYENIGSKLFEKEIEEAKEIRRKESIRKGYCPECFSQKLSFFGKCPRCGKKYY